MNKIVYAALLIGLTSTAASATAPVCTGNASQLCTDAVAAWNAVTNAPNLITTVATEITSGTSSNEYTVATQLIAPSSGLSNMVNNCNSNSSYSPQCPAAIKALSDLNTAVTAIKTDLASGGSTETALNGLSYLLSQQANDQGMTALASLVGLLNSLDAAVAEGQAIQPPPTMKRK